ncbi:MAG: AAA family ATPase [Oscillatoriaceae cyanobacterium Prado104]|jgi:predicted ATPase|nr:AAA family ATPase [Oscillatoriaceae cyanobacterium Prado104]
MSNQLTHLHIKNFRSLADLNLKINPLNIIFGPNGAGKTTLLDTIWFLRDCVIRGVDLAASERDHGIGLLWDGADEGENISIEIATPLDKYKVSFGYSSGRIEPFVGERLVSDGYNEPLIVRIVGSDKAQIYRTDLQKLEYITLKEPEKLALSRYVAFENSVPAASNTDNLLRQVRRYDSRSASLFKIKRFGSESDPGDRLQDRCDNLWSVLRNLHDKRVIDERYDTIISFMQESFPNFDNLFFEQTGRYTVYGNFLEKGRRKPIRASGVSDGHLQMLINLTALFSEGQNRYTLILFDEPEISLHPWALAVFAKAVKQAAEKWNKQVFIATHSPVLISQFESKNILTAELDRAGKTAIRRLSEIEGIQDLLAEYAAGSLYMAEEIAPQSKSLLEVVSE